VTQLFFDQDYVFRLMVEFVGVEVPERVKLDLQQIRVLKL